MQPSACHDRLLCGYPLQRAVFILAGANGGSKEPRTTPGSAFPLYRNVDSLCDLRIHGLLLHLLLDELAVQRMGGHQLFMRALAGHDAFLEEDDAVRADDR